MMIKRTTFSGFSRIACCYGVFRGLLAVALAAILAVVLLAMVATTPAQAAFPGQNGKIVYDYDDGDVEIYSMDPDGSNQTNLTNSPSSIEAEARVSPDGKKIVFASDRDNPGGKPKIYTMNADGSNQTRITNNAAADKQPAWSPDGKQITFISTRDGNQEIYKMNADGTRQTRLTKTSEYEYFPAWSPDGTKIAFSKWVYQSSTPKNLEIYQMNPRGSNVVRLTTNSSDDYAPVWSPDSKQIAFVRDATGGSSFCESSADIYKMNSNGTSPVRLTTNSASDCLPAWSPDGKQIAFTSDQDGNNEIYKINAADGTNPARLTQNPASEGYNDWGVAPTG